MLAAIAALAVCAFAGSALAPDGSSKAHPFAVRELAAKSAPNPLAGRLHKVYGTDIPASRYGTEIADLEDEGTNLAGEQVSELSPLPAAAFTAPEQEYRVYAVGWVSRALADAASLRQDLAAGDVADGRRAWEATWSDYLHLGAVYGQFGVLDAEIDGGAGGEARQGGVEPGFVGLHRIEKGLWTGESPQSLVGYGALLERDLRQLRREIPSVEITPLEYATRSHEILEDAERDLLSGMDVPWSREGVLGTAAGLAADEELFHTLEPLLEGRENTEGEVRDELLMLNGTLAQIRRDHGGSYPTLDQMGIYEREQLDGYVTGALTALQEMPGTLETKVRPPVPKLPAPSRAEKAAEEAAERASEGEP
jgi:iron uptake system EfeUOB component EfeO/EfeM